MKELTETMDPAGSSPSGVSTEVETIIDKGGKYLTFGLANEEYGIAILKIKEIIGMMPVTSMPQTPDFVKGVINLRGKVIPVVDLRLKFGIEPTDYTERTCIVVVEAQAASMAKCWEAKQCGKEQCPAYRNSDRRCWMISGTFCRDEIQGSFHEKIEACRECDFYQSMHRQRTVVTVGIVVDSVSEVLNIKGDDIEDTPTFGTKLNTDYILGMAKMEGGVKLLLDIDWVLSVNEHNWLDKLV